jgi:hypothetical protein
MKEQRGSWYLLTGVILGVGLGLLYAWAISPARVTNVVPENLAPEYKDDYRVAIASAYLATGDLSRAKARLQLLHDEDPAQLLAAQSQRYLAAGRPYIEAEALAALAAALEQNDNSEPAPVTATEANPSPPTASPSPTEQASPTPSEAVSPSVTEASASESETPGPSETPEPTTTRTPSPSPTPSETPEVTFTPVPTNTLTPTLLPPLVFSDQTLVCDPLITESQLRIYVNDKSGRGIAGVEVIIQDDGNEEHFFTGLKPDIDQGYADYTLQPGVEYSLQVGKGGEPITITAEECSQDEGEDYWGSWRLTFTTP